MKTIVRGVLLLGVLGAAGYGGYRYMQSRQVEPSGEIRLSGNIELEKVEIAFSTSGRLREVLVREGDRVTRGAVLARLDQDQLIAQRRREIAALQNAQAQVRRAESTLEQLQMDTSSERELRQAELRQAKARLAEVKSGARPEELGEAEAALSAAQAELKKAGDDLERNKILRTKDYIPAQQFNQYQLRYDTAKANVEQIQQRIKLLNAGPRDATVDAAQAQVERAEVAIRQLDSRPILEQQRLEEIAASQAEVSRAMAQINLIDVQIRNLEAAAPIDGIVMVLSAREGEVIGPGAVIMTVGAIERPWLRAYISEADLGRVKFGAAATVTTDSYPGKQYRGRVSYIASDAEFTPKQIQTPIERVKLVYEIRIEIPNPEQELKSNMPADVVIEATT